MNRRSAVRSAVRALATGDAVEWRAALDSASPDDASRPMLEALQLIDRIAQARDTIDSGQTPEGESTEEQLAGSGDRWGTMRLREIIGRGSHGIVYRALDERLNREVAVKLVRSAVQAPLVGRFLDEARLLARVRHPNVVTIHGAEIFDGQPGLWMERLEGCTLQEQVVQQGPLDAREAALVAVEVCRGLAAIHRAGVLHRDLKAENIMREPDGRVVLTDFSTSGVVDDAARLAGTPLYMAPEVLAGQPASERSDVYSTGVLTYFLLTGSLPVTGATVDDLRRAHAEGIARPFFDRQPAVPRALQAIVSRALARDPSARQASAADLAAELVAFLEHSARRPGWHRRAVAVLALSALLTTAAVALVWRPWATGPAPTGSVVEEAWLLVGAFDNTTGDPMLGASIEYALERELTNSSRLQMVSRARVDDTLRLMKRPPDSVLDRKTAQEIGLRDPAIRSFVVGRVEPAGPGFLLSATILDVSTGETRVTATARAGNAEGLAAAVRDLSDRLRRALGESAEGRHAARDALERVTTPSLEALRLYSESYRFGGRNEWLPALELVRLALDTDPEFPAARIWLAWCLMRANAPPEVYRAEAARALDLAPHATDWERLWILGSHHFFFGDDERGIAAYEGVLRLNPGHHWAAGNIAISLGRLGRYADAVAIAERLVAMRPNDHRTLNIAFSALRRGLHYADASDLARRMREIHEVEQRYWVADAWIFDAHVAWVSGDLAATLAELEKVVAGVSAAGDAAKASVLPDVAALYLALDRPDEAVRVLEAVTDTARRHLHRAVVAIHEGRLGEARALMQAARFGVADLRDLWDRVWVLARAGAVDEAHRLVALARQPAPAGSMMVEASRARNDWLDAAEAEVALAAGNPAAAVPLLERALPALTADVTVTPSQMYRAAEALAEALTALGREAEAIQVLETVLSRRQRETFAGAPLWALRCQRRLEALRSPVRR